MLRATVLLVSWVTIFNCGGSSMPKALKNSTFAHPSNRPVKLFIQETAPSDSLLLEYLIFLEDNDQRSAAERLAIALSEPQFVIEKKKYQETYINPFKVVADSTVADMTLIVHVAGLQFIREVSKIDHIARGAAGATAGAFLPVPVALLIGDSIRGAENYIELECSLKDNAIDRTVYSFNVRVVGGRNIIGGAKFDWMAQKSYEELLDNLLAR